MKFGRKDYDSGKATIPAGEPVFLLRGQDAFAAEVVRFYSHLVRTSGKPNAEAIFQSAQAQAAEMDKWAPKKDPTL